MKMSKYGVDPEERGQLMYKLVAIGSDIPVDPGKEDIYHLTG
jgi:hypothetical protein